MVNIGSKDEIIGYILNSSDEENEKLALFIAGMEAQKRAFSRKRKPPEDRVKRTAVDKNPVEK
jgi:hypothetical protein